MQISFIFTCGCELLASVTSASLSRVVSFRLNTSSPSLFLVRDASFQDLIFTYFFFLNNRLGNNPLLKSFMWNGLFWSFYASYWASQVALVVKNPPAKAGRCERPRFHPYIGKISWRRATHSSILAWRIPWTEEPGRLQSMGSQSDTTEAT